MPAGAFCLLPSFVFPINHPKNPTSNLAANSDATSHVNTRWWGEEFRLAWESFICLIKLYLLAFGQWFLVQTSLWYMADLFFLLQISQVFWCRKILSNVAAKCNGSSTQATVKDSQIWLTWTKPNVWWIITETIQPSRNLHQCRQTNFCVNTTPIVSASACAVTFLGVTVVCSVQTAVLVSTTPPGLQTSFNAQPGDTKRCPLWYRWMRQVYS